jgi:predicted RNA binding protein YcfA (HicA-like mRNA interferase family)
MKDISGKELCKILKQNGWELKTIKGSHHHSRLPLSFP